jgi:hypothetical protein
VVADRATVFCVKGADVPELFKTLTDIFLLLTVQLLPEVLGLILRWALPIVWVTWWLCAVNWRKAWPVLAEGAWVGLLLLVILGALVWSQVWPEDLPLFGTVVMANFWWQLIAIALLVGTALFCGWLQGFFGWTPHEISLEPAPASAPVAHH